MVVTRNMNYRKYVALSNPVYDQISKRVRESYPNSCIIFVEEVQNSYLDSRFTKREKSTGAKKISVFHGTSHNSVDPICSEGFKTQYNVTSAYGKGTYFADKAKTSRDYMKTKDSDEHKYMFLCDILLTSTTKVVDSVGYYVVANDHDCIPRYVIGFYI